MREEVSLPSGRRILALDEQGELWIRRPDGAEDSAGHIYEPVHFNKQYAGYYPRCAFTAIAGTEKGFAAAGTDEAGNTVLFRSLLGGVWEQIQLVCRGRVPSGRVVRMLVSERPEQLFLCCENGDLAVVPDCIRCIKLKHVTDRIVTDAQMEDNRIVLFTAEGDRIGVPLRQISQVRMHPEKALSEADGTECFVYLGNMPDSPYVQPWGRICLPQAVHIPGDKLREFLAGEKSGRKLFFFCDFGVRADEAAWEARHCGFAGAYSLGGICMPELD